MPIIFILSFILLITSCSRSSEDLVTIGNDKNEDFFPVVPEVPLPLFLTAGREYDPNFWHSTELIASIDGRYSIPLQIDISYGNGARGLDGFL